MQALWEFKVLLRVKKETEWVNNYHTLLKFYYNFLMLLHIYSTGCPFYRGPDYSNFKA